MMVAKDPARANIIARLKGNGSKRPLLIMGHSDTVRVDPAKWTFPPFSATREGGYVYGRGTLDDKSDLLAAMMTMLMLKRQKTPLDRDVIFVSEPGEEAATGPGHRIPGERALERHRRRVLSGRSRRRAAEERPGALCAGGDHREAAERRAAGRARTGRSRLAAVANQCRRASGEGGGDHRGLGPAHALQRHHALLLRKDGDGRAVPRKRRGSRGCSMRKKRRRFASIWPSTIRSTIRCCTPPFRPTSFRAAIR